MEIDTAKYLNDKLENELDYYKFLILQVVYNNDFAKKK